MKDTKLLILIIFIFFAVSFFNYKEGFDRLEWCGATDPVGKCNEHKTSGIPEIDSVKYNHRYSPPVYKESTEPNTNNYKNLYRQNIENSSGPNYSLEKTKNTKKGPSRWLNIYKY